MPAHQSEETTRQTTEGMGIATAAQRGFCEAGLQAKAKRCAGSRIMDKRASVKGKIFSVDRGGPTKHLLTLGGNSYMVIFVDDCTRLKVVKIVKKKSDTTRLVLYLIPDYITREELSVKCIWTNNGGEFGGEFQRKLDCRSITHEHAPTDTPQYNGVAERALGPLR